MIKKDILTFRGVNQDTSKSKHPKEFYFEGSNIRISATDSQSTGSITNEKGTEQILTIPIPLVDGISTIAYDNKILKYKGNTKTDVAELNSMYTGKTSGTQVIIGHTIARESIIVFSTDNNGFDCIWEVTDINDKYDISLLYIRDLDFSTTKPIQAVYNFENDNIQKVYWIDGTNQVRFINTRYKEDNENLIDIPSNTINIVGNFKISQPVVTSVSSGGSHTSGMIQYAYNLYRLNSSQTKLSPLTELVALDKGNDSGGGDINEVVGASPVVEIKDIDKEYTHIKVYAIKYTSYNQIPSVSLIEDREVGSTRKVVVFDDGNVIQDMSLSELLFLGSDPIVPKHIVSKDNILFFANIKEVNFDIDLDLRAYSFDATPKAVVYNNVSSTNRFKEEAHTINTTHYILAKNNDAVNLDYDTFNRQADGITRGGEGKYIKYEIVNSPLEDTKSKKFFKDNEIYRLGIQFYNRLGQKSIPKWLADFRAPEGNLEGNYNTLKVELKSEFYTWLNDSSNFESEDDKPVGYKIIRANRTLNDKTIITQGFLNGMISNLAKKHKSPELSLEARENAEKGNKLPSLQRVYGKHSQMEAMKHYYKLDRDAVNPEKNEITRAKGGDRTAAEAFQYNTLMQMYSPDVLFSSVSLSEGLSLRIKGANKNSKDQFWGQERTISTKTIEIEGKVLNNISAHNNNTNDISITKDVYALLDTGLIGPARKDDDKGKDDPLMTFAQFNREFMGGYVKAPTTVVENIYLKPQVTEKGQGPTNYNNDATYKYYNSLEPLITDGVDKSGVGKSYGLTSVNSWGAKCLTMVLGGPSADIKAGARPTLDKIYAKTKLTDTNVMLVGELVKSKDQIYLGGIYGGNTYEDKKRTDYIEIGEYKKIANTTAVIESPGDTFVQEFKFSKICKTDTEVYSFSTMQITEIVSGFVETSIDLSKRNDGSLSAWDARFQPRYDEFHNYNRVYSQEPTLVKNTDVDYNFRKVNNFDTKILASKTKVPGEFIDNWTDLLVNETQNLNGKYGPINSFVSFRDQLYTLQDSALAAIAVNPRVQVQGSDGISVELGKGAILHDYKYITTNSGTLNKWAVLATQYGIYYLDTENKCFTRFSDKLERLSDIKGLHTWFQNNLDYDSVKLDNPILGTGATIGYDLVNNSVLLSLHQPNPYTRLYSEASDSFIGLMDYVPSRYISNNSKLFSLDGANTGIHEHFKGEYNKFYGTYYPSYVTLLLNPAANYECVFDNIEFNSELYLDDVDQYDKTLTHIHGWNEYQDTGRIPLVMGRGSNLSRKFRTWRANVPRDGRNRLRNPWIYLKLELDNTNNYKLILHDIEISYTIS